LTYAPHLERQRLKSRKSSHGPRNHQNIFRASWLVFVNFYFLETQLAHILCYLTENLAADLSKGRGRRPHIPMCCFPHGESASNCEVQSLIRCTMRSCVYILFTTFIYMLGYLTKTANFTTEKVYIKIRKEKQRLGKYIHTVNIINSKHL